MKNQIEITKEERRNALHQSVILGSVLTMIAITATYFPVLIKYFS